MDDCNCLNVSIFGFKYLWRDCVPKRSSLAATFFSCVCAPSFSKESLVFSGSVRKI